jgi:hypothetical protein
VLATAQHLRNHRQDLDLEHFPANRMPVCRQKMRPSIETSRGQCHGGRHDRLESTSGGLRRQSGSLAAAWAAIEKAGVKRIKSDDLAT